MSKKNPNRIFLTYEEFFEMFQSDTAKQDVNGSLMTIYAQEKLVPLDAWRQFLKNHGMPNEMIPLYFDPNN